MSSGTPCLVDTAKPQKAFKHGAMGVERYLMQTMLLIAKMEGWFTRDIMR